MYGLKEEEKWKKNLREKHFQKLVYLSTYDNNNFKPKYIIWPESAFEFNLEKNQHENINLFNWLEKDFTPGSQNRILKINDEINFIPIICYEIIFPEKVINGERPDFLVNLTNDAWYRDSIGPVQHLSAARVRAIEEGITVIRVANTGISSVVSPSGKYLNKLSLEKEGIIDINFVKKSHPTLFSAYGNFIYIILSFFMINNE